MEYSVSWEITYGIFHIKTVIIHGFSVRDATGYLYELLKGTLVQRLLEFMDEAVTGLVTYSVLCFVSCKYLSNKLNLNIQINNAIVKT